MLRTERLGAAFSGAWPSRTLRRAVFAATVALPPLGRRMFASNLFVAARAKTARLAAGGAAHHAVARLAP